MKISKLIFLLGIASLVIIAVEARAANQSCLRAQIDSGYTEEMAPAASGTDQGTDEMGPASSAPDQENEEMAPASPTPEQGTEEMGPAGSPSDQGTDELAPATPTPTDEQDSSGSY